MAENRTGSLQIAKAAWKDFGEDECSVRAAALAYYFARFARDES